MSTEILKYEIHGMTPLLAVTTSLPGPSVARRQVRGDRKSGRDLNSELSSNDILNVLVSTEVLKPRNLIRKPAEHLKCNDVAPKTSQPEV